MGLCFVFSILVIALIVYGICKNPSVRMVSLPAQYRLLYGELANDLGCPRAMERFLLVAAYMQVHNMNHLSGMKMSWELLEQDLIMLNEKYMKRADFIDPINRQFQDYVHEWRSRTRHW